MFVPELLLDPSHISPAEIPRDVIVEFAFLPPDIPKPEALPGHLCPGISMNASTILGTLTASMPQLKLCVQVISWCERDEQQDPRKSTRSGFELRSAASGRLGEFPLERLVTRASCRVTMVSYVSTYCVNKNYSGATSVFVARAGSGSLLQTDGPLHPKTHSRLSTCNLFPLHIIFTVPALQGMEKQIFTYTAYIARPGIDSRGGYHDGHMTRNFCPPRPPGICRQSSSLIYTISCRRFPPTVCNF